MEADRTAQMVAWLDEERRKDKATINELRDRVSRQEALIEEQARRLQNLENELAALRSKTLSVAAFEEAIARLRNELNALLEQAEARRLAAEQDAKRLRDTDRDALVKAMEELRQEMITRLDRAMQPRRAEEERLSRVASELQTYADNLGKGLEEFERSLAFLEEQRRLDARRIADLSGEIGDVAKRVEGQQAKLDLLEDLSRRNERAVDELSGALNEFKQQRLAWMEQQALADQKREQLVGDMLRRLESFAEDMGGFAKQVENWAETHREMKKLLQDYERLAGRVDRRLNEVSEAQRLSEERFRHEWDEFQADDQKRWRQFTLTNEEAWRENEKALGEVRAQLARLTEQTERQREYINLMAEIQQGILKILAEGAQELREKAEAGRGALPPL